MDASDPERRRVLEDSLKDLAWTRQEAKESEADIEKLATEVELLHDSGKIDELEYQTKLIRLEKNRTAVRDTLRMIQRQRALITSWLIEAEKKK